MPKVQIQILPGLSSQFTPEQRGRLVFEERMEENSTLKDLLNELAAAFEACGEVLFDLQAQQIYPNVRVVINGRLLIPLEEMDLRLRDGDRIVFLPAYAGG